MEGIRRRDSSSPSMLADLTPTQSCENELSPSDSDLNSNSSLTFDNSKGRLYQIEDSSKDCLTAWTDEKHDLYLDHLESSFIEQLRRSWCSDYDSKTHYLSLKSVSKSQNTSKKFKLIQDDCLDKIDLKRKTHHMFAVEEFTEIPNDVAEFSDQNFAVEVSEQTCRKKRSKTIL